MTIADQNSALERSGGESPELWWCRVEPLGRDRWSEIATKGYVDNVWRSLPIDTAAFAGSGRRRNAVASVRLVAP
jgi:hypothetical protein